MSLRLIIIVFLIVAVSYMLYLVIGMSSTYDSIKEYYFHTDSSGIGHAILSKTTSTPGWSYELSDTVGLEQGKTRYWIDLFYNNKTQKLKYSLKFCDKENHCSEVSLIGAFDYLNKNGGYKISDDGVAEMLVKIEESIFEDLAPICND